MKAKLLFLMLMLFATHTTKADGVTYSILHNLKIAAIDDALNEAKTLEEVKVVTITIFQFIFRDFNDTCPTPEVSDYQVICGHVAARTKPSASNPKFFIEYWYEKYLLQMACVNFEIDSEEAAKKKLQVFWNKYKTNCTCDSLDFQLSNGNFLKFALSQKMPEVVETLAETYGLDINFIDPKDGLNLLDYILAEINSLKKLPDSAASVKVWEEYKVRIMDVGGKSNTD